MTKDSEHLLFIYWRLVNVYHENENTDFMLRFMEIIKKAQTAEEKLKSRLEKEFAKLDK